MSIKRYYLGTIECRTECNTYYVAVKGSDVRFFDQTFGGSCYWISAAKLLWHGEWLLEKALALIAEGGEGDYEPFRGLEGENWTVEEPLEVK